MEELHSAETAVKAFKIPHPKLAYRHYNQDDSVSHSSSVGNEFTSITVPPCKYSQTTRPVTYTWENLTVETSVTEGNLIKRNRRSFRKKLLNNVSGAARPGEFIAIMGASGAGKTTLLNSLTFRTSGSLKTSGDRHLNGAPVNSNVLARISTYIQQDDLFIGTMKVWEVLRFQALLRMDMDFTDEQRMERVEQVIRELGLSKCRNTFIGLPDKGIKGISGGERKRLAFACEVLTNPSLMFCDEPTSGLDSFMAQTVVQALRNMAYTGKTVICTIHQPSSEVFAMFDRILLMADGKTAFLGPISEALEFFSSLGLPCPANFNPADHFIFSLATAPGSETECLENIAAICEAYNESEAGKRIAAVVDKWHRPDPAMLETLRSLDDGKRKSPYKASWSSQFSAVFWRSFLNVLRDPAFLVIKGLGSILLSLLIALFYQGQELSPVSAFNIQGVLFLFISNATIETIFAVISTFSFELPIFLREQRNGMYRTDVYFLCKTFAELFVYIIYPFVSFAIPYYIIGLNPDVERFFIASGIILLVTNTASSFGYMISCLGPSPQIALAMSSPLLLPLFLFGGFFLQSGTVPLYLDWLKYLSWFMYGNEALSINQWHGVEFNSTICELFDNITSQLPQGSSVSSGFPEVTSSPLSSLLELIVRFMKEVRSNIICNGDDILERFNFKPEYFTRDILCLVALIVGFRVIAYLALLAKTYRT